MLWFCILRVFKFSDAKMINMAGAIILAVSTITAKEARGSPKPLKNYRPAFESIVLGKPLVSQDQQLVATVKGIMKKLDTHSSEKGVGEQIKAIQVDFAARIDNNIIKMGLENLDFLVTTVPKEHLPRLLEICHREMLENPDRADAIPRVLGNIHLISGVAKLSDDSIRRMMRTGFAKSTSLCPKEVSTVLNAEYDSGRLDHIEGIAEARAAQEQTAMLMVVNASSGFNTRNEDIKTQDVTVAANSTVYFPMGNVDTTAIIQYFVQSPYASLGQMETNGYKIRECPDCIKSEINSGSSAAFQANVLVQEKIEQRTELVQPSVGNLIVLPLGKMPKNERVFDELTGTTTQIGSLHPESKAPSFSNRTEEVARYQPQFGNKEQATKEGNEKDLKAQRFKVKKQKTVKSTEPKKREEWLAHMPNATNEPKHRKNKEKKMWQRKKPPGPRNERGKAQKPEKERTDNHFKAKEKKKGELTKENVKATNKCKVKSERVKKRRGGKEKEEITKSKEKKVALKDTKNLRRELSDKRKKREKAGKTATENKKKRTRQRSAEPKNAWAIVRKASKRLPRAVSYVKTDQKTQRERQKRRILKKGILKILLIPRKKRKRTVVTSSRAQTG